jgi:hypothetical protein
MIVNEIIVDKDIKLLNLTIDDSPLIYEAIGTNRKFPKKWLSFVDSN